MGNLKNRYISKIYKSFSRINENSFSHEISLQSINVQKKSLNNEIKNESFFAKICLREILEFNKTISKWKIVNNSSLIIKGLKSKNYITKQKKNLKKIILRKS
jgi:hypothetical protein|mmetsp:Transcript_26993/g.43341  ORF Transcript_26993/g.43341 Transcript_26993/m.43341 type:complete len:103 (+) Transcript_26993:727-1035(+)